MKLWIAFGAVAALGISTVVFARAQRPSTIAVLFEQYRHGDADAAVRTLAGWPSSRVASEGGTNPAPGDPSSDAAFALFNTEASFQRGIVGRNGNIDSSGLLPTRDDAPFTISFDLMDRVAARARERGDSRLLAVAKSWCILAGSWAPRIWWQLEEPRFSEFAARHFPDDPEAILFRAALTETRIGPETEEQGGYHFVDLYAPDRRNGVSVPATKARSSHHGYFNFERALQIEKLLRRALALDPALVEARMRLGRFLFLMGDNDKAAEALEQAVQDSRNGNQVHVGYLAAMFLGQLREEDGQGVAASAAFTQASAFLPAAPAARLALGRLEILSGRVNDGWTDVRGLFGDAGSSMEPIVDPWVDYPSAESWQRFDRLRALRWMIQASAPKNLPPVAPSARSPGLPSRDGETPAPLQTSASSSPQKPGTFRTAVNGVRVDVYVSDGGRPVTGLSAADFEIRDNNVVQRVDAASGVTNLSVAIALDLSASTQNRGVSVLAQAGHTVVSSLMPADVASLVTFDDRIRLPVRQTRNNNAMHDALDADRPAARRSAVWDATMAAASIAAAGDGRSVVVVLTDQADNSSWLTQSPLTRSPTDERAKLTDLFRRTGILLDVFSLSEHRPNWEPDPPWDPFGTVWDAFVGNIAGKETAEPTGGTLFLSEQPGFPAKIAKQFADLRAGYVLTFTPTGVGDDDGWHKLSVKLSRGKGTVTTARPGYFANEVKAKGK